jgi:hypothetical protein
MSGLEKYALVISAFAIGAGVFALLELGFGRRWRP